MERLFLNIMNGICRDVKLRVPTIFLLKFIQFNQCLFESIQRQELFF